MAGDKLLRLLSEEVAPQNRQLLASLGEATVFHLGNAPGVIQGVPPQRSV